jgi:transposase
MDHLGVDLSKAYFDVRLLKLVEEELYARFDNNASGFAKLQKWLKAHGVSELHVCMEATNVYWEALAQFLYDKGYTVSVVNPARIKGFALSQLRRSKTDKLDSDVNAHFCRSQKPKAWKPATPEQRKLRSLVRHRDSLLQSLTQQKNRLVDCQDEECKDSLRTLISCFQTEIESTEAKIEKQIEQHPSLKQSYLLLRSVKGLGPVSSWTLLAEMPDLADYEDAAAAAADAGVTPSHHESGETVRRKSKISKVGKASVRGVLYLPALTAIRWNPIIKAFAERLEKKGKPFKVIILAVIRKLIHLAYGVLKNSTPFDPNYGKKPLPAT